MKELTELVAVSTSKPINANELDIAFKKFQKVCKRKNILLKLKIKKLWNE